MRRDHWIWRSGSAFDIATSAYLFGTGKAQEGGALRGKSTTMVVVTSTAITVGVDLGAEAWHQRDPAAKGPGRLLRWGGLVRFAVGIYGLCRFGGDGGH